MLHLRVQAWIISGLVIKLFREGEEPVEMLPIIGLTALQWLLAVSPLAIIGILYLSACSSMTELAPSQQCTIEACSKCPPNFFQTVWSSVGFGLVLLLWRGLLALRKT